MQKRDCSCMSCKARDEQEFFDIVYNVANGQWFVSTAATVVDRINEYSQKG